METPSVLTDLFVLFAAARILGELLEHFRQPSVVGELLGGLLVGPHLLGWVGPESGPLLEIVAELGVIILLFTVGLETRLEDLRAVGRAALLVGVVGSALPFAAGYGVATAFGEPLPVALFVAAALAATSAGVTARVLRDLGAVTSIVGRVILGAAVVDDVLALVALAVVVGVVVDGASALGLAITVVEVLVFLALVLLAGPRVVRRLSDLAHLPIIPRSPFVFAVLVTLGLAALSETIGLAALVGAFLAGLIVEFRKEEIAHQVEPVYELLVPFFFALAGSRLDPALFGEPVVLGLAGAVIAVAVVAKVAGGWLGSRSLGPRTAAAVGVGMIPRGGADIVAASVGLGLGVLTGQIYAVILSMSVVTAVMTPPALAPLVARAKGEARRRPSRPRRRRDTVDG